MSNRFAAMLCIAVFAAYGVASSAAQIGLASSAPKMTYKPKAGYVPDAGTAILIAEAILVPIYGADQIRNERPFRATLQGQTWFVQGSLPPGYDGGVAEVEISKDDGRILRVMHGK